MNDMHTSIMGDYTIPLRVVVSGNVDSSKSTLLGRLKTGEIDDGAGKVRQHIFNYPHEKKTGRTSSVAQRTMNIDGKKVIFFDLPGHEKYLRTTLFGMSSSYPHLALILVEPNRIIEKRYGGRVKDDLPPMTKEHIITALYLRIPFAFIITKMDIATKDRLQRIVILLKNITKNLKKRVWDVKKQKDVDLCARKLNPNLVPMFYISNVREFEIDKDGVEQKDEKYRICPPFSYLTNYLNALNIHREKINEKENLSLFVIDKSFRTKGFPLIGSGYMRRGRIDVGEKLWFGPVNGKLILIAIRSIHDDNKVDVSFLRKNEIGCISFKAKDDIINNKHHIRAGMVITNNSDLRFVKQFVCRVTIFSSHHTTIKRHTNTALHCGTVRKTVIIDDIYRVDENGENKNLECIRGGDVNVHVKFRFLQGAHYLEIGDLFVFREGNTRGSGIVEQICS